MPAVTPAHRTIRELATTEPPGYAHPEWLDRFPWLVQGTTARGDPADPFDLGLFSQASAEADVRARWDALLRATDVTLAQAAWPAAGPDPSIAALLAHLHEDTRVTARALCGLENPAHATVDPLDEAGWRALQRGRFADRSRRDR